MCDNRAKLLVGEESRNMAGTSWNVDVTMPAICTQTRKSAVTSASPQRDVDNDGHCF